MSGTVYLMVGPSGVGKDTLLDRARLALPDLAIAQRYITRPADAGGEAHADLTTAEFERMVDEHEFCVWWRAHGLGYGISRDIADHVARGGDVIINTSRGSIAAFEAIFDNVVTIAVTCSAARLRERLLARGRETDAEIEARLARASPPVEARCLIEIANDGDIETAATALIEILGGLRQRPPA